jgi:hypothetical protein
MTDLAIWSPGSWMLLGSVGGTLIAVAVLLTALVIYNKRHAP